MSKGQWMTSSLLDPAMLPFLPMIYVAWADGDLRAAEMAKICTTVNGDYGDCSARFGPWLDPDRPPTAVELQQLLMHIRERSVDLDSSRRINLSELGLELAQAGDYDVSDQERRALVEVEEALGVTGFEAARQLLATRHRAAPRAEEPPSFEVSGLSRLLNGDRARVREELFELLSTEPFGFDTEISRDRYRQRALECCKALAEAGYGAVGYPVEFGGGGDQGSFVRAFEVLAFQDSSVLIKFGVQFGLFGGSVLNLGTERHHRELLGPIGRLELPGCFAMTETAHGSNVYDLETVASYDPESLEFVIHTPHEGARKDYIGNAACHGRMATVFAQLEVGGAEHGVHAFVVPLRDESGATLAGVRIEDCGAKLGLNGVDNGRLWFDRVRVPRTALLDRFATVSENGEYESPIASPSRRFFTMLGTLVGGRVSIAAAAQSASKSALTIAIRYGLSRRQFGPPAEAETQLLDYLTHQRRLLPPLAAAYGLHFAISHLQREYLESSDDDRREVEALAAGLKAVATQHATATIQTCRECCGGQGYLAINRFASLKADTDVFTTFEGDNIVLLQLVAKSLLSGYKRQFNELGAWGLVRHVAREAARTVAELNPVVTRKSDEQHLLDRELHRSAFDWRTRRLLVTVAGRLKRRLDSGLDSQQALIECQDHLVRTAIAHVEQVILEQFAQAVESADESFRRPLSELCDLFALATIEADAGWFLETGFLEPSKAKAIRTQVNLLCGRVRAQCGPLVDAFGIPEAMLKAPIGR